MKRIPNQPYTPNIAYENDETNPCIEEEESSILMPPNLYAHKSDKKTEVDEEPIISGIELPISSQYYSSNTLKRIENMDSMKTQKKVFRKNGNKVGISRQK